MIDVLRSDVALLILTVGAYLLGTVMRNKLKTAVLNPIFTAVFFVILYLKFFEIDYEAYRRANSIISFALELSVVALGYLLYKHYEDIRQNALTVLVSITCGSVVGILSVVAISMMFGVPNEIMLSLQPKSVTTPIAVLISEHSGGLSPLTAIVVIITGVFGNVFGKYILTLVGVNSPIAEGLALGSAAHGVGTAKAIELGAIQGATGGLAIGIMGAITSVLVPLVNLLLF